MTFDSKIFLNNISQLPGIYQMFDDTEKIIYIGKAKNLKNRLSSYFNNKNLGAKNKSLVAKIVNIKTTITHTETEALILENHLIKKHQPRYNILLRDDKSYPYIYLSNHQFPRVSFHRGAQKKIGQYFGPYPSSNSVKESLRLLQKIFPVRQCEDSFFSHRSRPCLQAQIKRCTAPCVGLISNDEYAKDVENTVLFLQGKDKTVMNKLQRHMCQASDVQDYESAGKFRNQIINLQHIQEKQFVDNLYGSFDILAIVHKENYACVQLFVYRNGRSLGNKVYFLRQIKNHNVAEILQAFIAQHYLDKNPPVKIICNINPTDVTTLQTALSINARKKIIIKTASRGEKVQLIKNAIINAKIALKEHINRNISVMKQLKDLQQICKMDFIPKYMECFDISHTFGEATVASCVVFKNGTPSKADYRKFNIKTAVKSDDYGAMREAIRRRYIRVIKSDANLPDLLIVDGGKGQLNQAIKVLKELQINIPILGVAKGEKRQPGKESLFLAPANDKLLIPSDSSALFLIQKIRDESHRFAITGHRKQRNKNKLHSVLQNIDVIGNKRRQILLNYFGGLQEIKKAGVLDLTKVPGIGKETAQKIYDYFHTQGN